MSRTQPCDKENSELAQELAAWYQHPPGDRVVAHERDVLAGMVGDLFGYQLLQLGGLGPDLDYLAACPIRRKTLLGHLVPDDPGSLIVADANFLPIMSDSIDAVILAHTLDFAPDPHQVLREVERVLIPEGRVIVIGFNPYSLWGLWRLFGRWRGTVPWCGHFLSYPRLNDWLTLLGFGIERMDVLEFRPPTRRGRMEVIDRVGRRVWPMLAGVYVVRAVKRVSRITPVRQLWPSLRVLGPRAIEPTTRQVRDA